MERQEFDLNDYSLEVRDGKAVLERKAENEPQLFTPSDGACVADADGDLFIHYKEGDTYFSHGSYIYWNRRRDELLIDTAWNMTVAVRFATEEEIIALSDRLAKEGLEWNSKNKKLRKKRWRAARNHEYYIVDAIGEVRYLIECGADWNDRYYSFDNYFRTREQAEEVAEEVRKVFEKYKE